MRPLRKANVNWVEAVPIGTLRDELDRTVARQGAQPLVNLKRHRMHLVEGARHERVVLVDLRIREPMQVHVDERQADHVRRDVVAAEVGG